MKLTIINGSPRGKKSNSNMISTWIKEQLPEDTVVQEFYPTKLATHQEIISSLESNSTILVIFPLYTDNVPFVVKRIFEEMDTLKGKLENVNIYYIVHSGFSGGNHSRAVERYLEYFAKYMGFNYKGTAIKPSSEGLRLMPPAMTKRTALLFKLLAEDIIQSKPFDLDIIKKLIKREKPSRAQILTIKSGMGDMYFKNMLKRNKVLDQAENKPYKKHQ